jgi:Fic family protein
MADWDENSPELGINLAELSLLVRDEALLRTVPTVAAARDWHRLMMRNLKAPNPDYVGKYRGESGLEGVNVRIGTHYGIRSDLVAAELANFEQTLQGALAALDEDIPVDDELTADQFKAVIDVCAWVHAECVRIHPFANGNGRMARVWANYVAMRYGLPAFARLRPRPDSPYDAVASEAMHGVWQATVPLFQRMCRDAMRRRA